MITRSQMMDLLMQVLWALAAKDKRARDLAARLGGAEIGQNLRLGTDDIEYICAVLVNELTETGLDRNSEPTERGMSIEDTIDWVRSQEYEK